MLTDATRSSANLQISLSSRIGRDLERVAGVVAVEVEGRDDDRGVDTDRVPWPPPSPRRNRAFHCSQFHRDLRPLCWHRAMAGEARSTGRSGLTTSTIFSGKRAVGV